MKIFFIAIAGCSKNVFKCEQIYQPIHNTQITPLTEVFIWIWNPLYKFWCVLPRNWVVWKRRGNKTQWCRNHV